MVAPLLALLNIRMLSKVKSLDKIIESPRVADGKFPFSECHF